MTSGELSKDSANTNNIDWKPSPLIQTNTYHAPVFPAWQLPLSRGELILQFRTVSPTGIKLATEKKSEVCSRVVFS